MHSPIHLPMCLSTHLPINPLSTHTLSSHNRLPDTPLPHVSISHPSTYPTYNSGSACISYNPRRLPSISHHPYHKLILSFLLPMSSKHKFQTLLGFQGCVISLFTAVTVTLSRCVAGHLGLLCQRDGCHSLLSLARVGSRGL